LLALKATSKLGDDDTIEVIRHIRSKRKTSVYVDRKKRRIDVVFVNARLRAKKERQRDGKLLRKTASVALSK
jgi:hypothetical protein